MSSLKENSRWKIDSKEKNSFEQQKRKRNNTNDRDRYNKNDRYNQNDRYRYNRNEKQNIKKEEININNEELFPSLVNEENKNIAMELKSKYLEKIKIQKEKEEEKNKNILKEGWIAYKLKKGTNKIQVSRNGIDYYDSLRETYTEEEREENEKQEFNKEMKIMSYRLEQLYLKRKKESDEYYYETGKLDSFALAERDRLEYEEYLKKFEEEYENIEESSDDEIIDDDIYNSDEEYNKR